MVHFRFCFSFVKIKVILTTSLFSICFCQNAWYIIFRAIYFYLLPGSESLPKFQSGAIVIFPFRETNNYCCPNIIASVHIFCLFFVSARWIKFHVIILSEHLWYYYVFWFVWTLLGWWYKLHLPPSWNINEIGKERKRSFHHLSTVKMMWWWWRVVFKSRRLTAQLPMTQNLMNDDPYFLVVLKWNQTIR